MIKCVGKVADMKRRNKIVYMPYPVKGNKINEYLTNMVRILQDEYMVLGSLAEPTDLSQMLRTKAVILNWIENLNQLDPRMKIQLMLYKLLGARIIWVFHDRCPHDIDPDSKDIDILNMNWLADHCSDIMLHSKNSRKYIPNFDRNAKKAFYVPHILYERQNEGVDLDAVMRQYGITGDDFVFTMFGIIRPYKNIEGGIKAFQNLHMANSKLLIAGNPSDSDYARKIRNMCQGDTNIVLDFHYISNAMLDSIIDLSDVVVMPYHGGSSMNSGVMIQAFSRGTTVIAPDICMARDMATEKFMYIYGHSLEKVMLKAYQCGKKANRQMGTRAREYMYKNNNREVVKQQLYKLFQ